jgi:L-amino acid N-acyltransferase YncA
VRVRLATLEDAEAIRSIYNVEVLESTVTFDLVPRSLSAQQEWMTARSGAHAVVVAEDGNDILGFASLSPYKERPAYRTTVEDSIYVRRDQQGRGVGKAMLAELLTLATQHGFHAMMGRIVGGHEASIALHQGAGFSVVGTEREVGRKFGRWLDVVVMQRLLSR